MEQNDLSIIPLKENGNGKYNILSYLNSLNNFITFKVDSIEKTDLELQLFNNKDKLLFYYKWKKNEIVVSFHNYLSGEYILKIMDKGDDVKILKIIKP